MGTRDSYDILVLDEHSTDTTASDLARFGVRTLYVNQSIGVTALWNLAYQHYLEHGYKNLIYSNNDVLVPNGVIDKLRAALDNGCDLVMPISTVRGLGHIGKVEGLEVCCWCMLLGCPACTWLKYTPCLVAVAAGTGRHLCKTRQQPRQLPVGAACAQHGLF